MRYAVLTSVSVLAMAVASNAVGQERLPNYSFYGTPGLLEMPGAAPADEGTLATTVSYREGLFQTVVNLQLTDRLSGSFRYALVDLYDDLATGVEENSFESGFNLQFQILEETETLPAIAVGMRDILTPGRFQSEYLVASKSFGDNLTVTAGLGWGAMGQRNGFDNPISSLAVRPVFDETDPEGQLATDQWFAGDAAFFGGVEYQVNERWGVVAEYSSLAYPDNPNSPALDGDSPYSLGVTYRPADGMQFSAAVLNGSNFGLSGTFVLNANTRPGMAGLETAPLPVRARSAGERAAPATQIGVTQQATIRNALSAAFATEGLDLRALQIDGDTARVRFTNGRYRSNAQAMGRAARILTQAMPGQVDTFVLEQVDRGIPLSGVRISRADLEALENRPGAAEALLARTAFVDAGPDEGLSFAADPSPAFEWGYAPYFRIEPFAVSGKLTLDVGVSVNASYRLSPQMDISASVLQSLTRNEASDPVADSTPDLQNVRTDSGAYGDDGVPVLQSLAFTHYGRPGTDLYSRVSVGYLERMFGGISTELLWKPADSRLGIGAELNYVAQRNTDMWFGFDEYDYQVATGHLSAYYDLGNGYHTQIDVGRYLAGDWGATIELAREYENGIRIAASVSQTEVSYEDFGDGSYNKGVTITLPQDFFTGRATRSTYSTRLNTRSGDGGARLNVDGRLYDIVRGAHQSDLSSTWGRFWR